MRRRDESRKIKAITCNKKRDGESELKGGGGIQQERQATEDKKISKQEPGKGK